MSGRPAATTVAATMIQVLLHTLIHSSTHAHVQCACLGIQCVFCVRLRLTGAILEEGRSYVLTAWYYGTVIGQTGRLWVDHVSYAAPPCGPTSAIGANFDVDVTTKDTWQKVSRPFVGSSCLSLRIHLHECPDPTCGAGWSGDGRYIPLQVLGTSYWDNVGITTQPSSQ